MEVKIVVNFDKSVVDVVFDFYGMEDVMVEFLEQILSIGRDLSFWAVELVG